MIYTIALQALVGEESKQQSFSILVADENIESAMNKAKSWLIVNGGPLYEMSGDVVFNSATKTAFTECFFNGEGTFYKVRCAQTDPETRKTQKFWMLVEAASIEGAIANAKVQFIGGYEGTAVKGVDTMTAIISKDLM